MKHKIITISREFGSGGRELGKRLSDQLGVPYFDREILEELSKRLSMEEDYIEKITEKYPFGITLHFNRSISTFSQVTQGYTEILGIQHKLLKEIAGRESCIIVGRGANVILEEYEPFNIFVYADAESKVKRCKERAAETEVISEKVFLLQMKEIDRARAKTQELFSSSKWGEKSGYHLCVNTSWQEIKNLTPAVASYITAWFEGRNL
ncbi:cytidylate kinase-like family protein [Lachnospiraceae bacterium KK002]